MSNAIQMAVQSVKYSIPKMILEDVFFNRYVTYRSNPISIEERIRREVVLGRVLPDCQLEYGVSTFIPLAGLVPDVISPTERVFHIPLERTGGLSIMSALSVAYMNGGYGSMGVGSYMNNRYDGGVIMQATDWMLNAHDNLPLYASSRVTLVGENAILVKGDLLLSDNLGVYVILENDEAINTLKPKSIPVFKQLVLLAVKAYIYNTLVLEIDSARLSGGFDLGRYKEIVDSYSDANEMYEEMLNEKIGVLFFLNDEEQTSRHIRLMLGGPR